MKHSIRNGLAAWVLVTSLTAAMTLWSTTCAPVYFAGDAVAGLAFAVLAWAIGESS